MAAAFVSASGRRAERRLCPNAGRRLCLKRAAVFTMFDCLTIRRRAAFFFAAWPTFCRRLTFPVCSRFADGLRLICGCRLSFRCQRFGTRKSAFAPRRFAAVKKLQPLSPQKSADIFAALLHSRPARVQSIWRIIFMRQIMSIRRNAFRLLSKIARRRIIRSA